MAICRIFSGESANRSLVQGGRTTESTFRQNPRIAPQLFQ